MLKKALKYYFLFCGLTFHFTVIVLIVIIASDKISNNWRFKEVQRIIKGPIDNTPVFQIPRNNEGLPDYHRLPIGNWIKIHHQTTKDTIRFDRQKHSGSAWDSKRNRLIIFGSDTHGKNWDNSIYTFDLNSLSWKQEYQPTSVPSYQTLKSGLPISGNSNNPIPWAMHTFDAINYLPESDELLVASFPKHIKPGRFGDWLANVWNKATSHPTWAYSFNEKKWLAAEKKAEHFFPYSTAYDSDRNIVVGFQPYGIFEFKNKHNGWQKIANKSVNAYHTQAIYDSKNSTFLIFGGNTSSNAIHAYRVGDQRSKEMPTEGTRPPGTQHMPFAFHENNGETIALIDSPEKHSPLAQTWSYNLNLDRWKRIQSADFPFKLGMNYHMQYSKQNNLLVLCANAPKEAPSVWVLRL